MTTAFPLAWPESFPRSKTREKGSFKTSLSTALANVKESLARFGADSRKKVDNVVLSSNVALGVQHPEDPGVAVWFLWDGMQVCIPVDRYQTPEANLQAIFHVLEARRTELRHGTLALVRATMTGFVALPRPDWRRTFGWPSDRQATRAEIRARYVQLARVRHPDGGGTADTMAELNRARDAAFEEVSG